MTYVFAASVFACIRQVAVAGVINFSIENIAPIYQFRPVWATVWNWFLWDWMASQNRLDEPIKICIIVRNNPI